MQAPRGLPWLGLLLATFVFFAVWLRAPAWSWQVGPGEQAPHRVWEWQAGPVQQAIATPDGGALLRTGNGQALSLRRLDDGGREIWRRPVTAVPDDAAAQGWLAPGSTAQAISWQPDPRHLRWHWGGGGAEWAVPEDQVLGPIRELDSGGGLVTTRSAQGLPRDWLYRIDGRGQVAWRYALGDGIVLAAELASSPAAAGGRALVAMLHWRDPLQFSLALIEQGKQVWEAPLAFWPVQITAAAGSGRHFVVGVHAVESRSLDHPAVGWRFESEAVIQAAAALSDGGLALALAPEQADQRPRLVILDDSGQVAHSYPLSAGLTSLAAGPGGSVVGAGAWGALWLRPQAGRWQLGFADRAAGGVELNRLRTGQRGFLLIAPSGRTAFYAWPEADAGG